MTNLKSLSWNERFAIIEALNPNDEQIQTALNIDADELATARELLEAGQFSLDTDIDASPYVSVFAAIAVATTDIDNPTGTTATSPRKRSKPATATKPEKVAKKRGRKGTKIQEAFAAISSRAVSAENFASKHDVSLNVLRQAKRFDRSGQPGRVRVKQIKGVLSIFREVS